MYFVFFSNTSLSGHNDIAETSKTSIILPVKTAIGTVASIIAGRLAIKNTIFGTEAYPLNENQLFNRNQSLEVVSTLNSNNVLSSWQVWQTKQYLPFDTQIIEWNNNSYLVVIAKTIDKNVDNIFKTATPAKFCEHMSIPKTQMQQIMQYCQNEKNQNYFDNDKLNKIKNNGLNLSWQESSTEACEEKIKNTKLHNSSRDAQIECNLFFTMKHGITSWCTGDNKQFISVNLSGSKKNNMSLYLLPIEGDHYEPQQIIPDYRYESFPFLISLYSNIISTLDNQQLCKTYIGMIYHLANNLSDCINNSNKFERFLQIFIDNYQHNNTTNLVNKRDSMMNLFKYDRIYKQLQAGKFEELYAIFKKIYFFLKVFNNIWNENNFRKENEIIISDMNNANIALPTSVLATIIKIFSPYIILDDIVLPKNFKEEIEYIKKKYLSPQDIKMHIYFISNKHPLPDIYIPQYCVKMRENYTNNHTIPSIKDFEAMIRVYGAPNGIVNLEISKKINTLEGSLSKKPSKELAMMKASGIKLPYTAVIMNNLRELGQKSYQEGHHTILAQYTPSISNKTHILSINNNNNMSNIKTQIPSKKNIGTFKSNITPQYSSHSKINQSNKNRSKIKIFSDNESDFDDNDKEYELGNKNKPKTQTTSHQKIGKITSNKNANISDTSLFSGTDNEIDFNENDEEYELSKRNIPQKLPLQKKEINPIYRKEVGKIYNPATSGTSNIQKPQRVFNSSITSAKSSFTKNNQEEDDDTFSFKPSSKILPKKTNFLFDTDNEKEKNEINDDEREPHDILKKLQTKERIEAIKILSQKPSEPIVKKNNQSNLRQELQISTQKHRELKMEEKKQQEEKEKREIEESHRKKSISIPKSSINNIRGTNITTTNTVNKPILKSTKNKTNKKAFFLSSDEEDEDK